GQVRAAVGQRVSRIGVSALEGEGQRFSKCRRVPGPVQGWRPVDILNVNRHIRGVAKTTRVPRAEVQDIIAGLVVIRRPLEHTGVRVNIGAGRQWRSGDIQKRIAVQVGSGESELEWSMFTTGLRN